MITYFKQTKLRYNELPGNEKQWLVRIMQKSELVKSPTPQWGKRGK